MKKFSVLLLCLFLMVALLAACGKQAGVDATEAKDYAGTFRVGFGRMNITPDVGIGLSGYGDDGTRRAKDIESPLYVTCVAITDESENTLLLFSLDNIRTEPTVCNPMRTELSEMFQIPRENIFFSATHSHNTPDSATGSYCVLLQQQSIAAAKEAMADRLPAQMYIGTAYSQGLNFVRHYVMSDGTYCGDGYGDVRVNEIVGHETEVDNAVQLIKFTREAGKDVVLMNWRAHPILFSGASYYSISSCYVGACRTEMEKTADCHFAYFQGASGNVRDESYIASEENFRNHKELGQKLAWCALEILDDLKQVNTGPVEVKTVNYKGNVRRDPAEYAAAGAVYKSVIESGGTVAEAIAATGGMVNNTHVASGMDMRITQYNAGGGKFNLEIAAIAIGDVAFISTPCEMFDNTGKQIKDASPYEQTFVLYLTNGRGKYLVSEPAFTNGCYEKENSYFVKGTAEELVTVYTDMLNEVHAEGLVDPKITTFDSKLPNG